MKTALFLYDFTGIMAQPWLDAGYRCISFDGQHLEGITRDGKWYKVGIWFTGDINDDLKAIAAKVNAIAPPAKPEFVFGFPECTHMAVSGARHFAAKLDKDPDIQNRAARLAMLVEYVANLYGAKWGAENPVSVLSSLWRKPDFSFHPYEFGGYLPENDRHPLYPDYIKPRDAYPKKTCIWCGNGFKKPPLKPVHVDEGYSVQYHKLGGRSLKTKNIRSATPRGFAAAVFLANSGV
ncbi:Dcm methylase [Citrobacter farmeri]